MARVHTVEKAQASKRSRRCGRCGTEIKAGDRYYWIKTRTHRAAAGITKTFCAKHPPRASDQTSSPHLQTIYSAIETAEDDVSAWDGENIEDLRQILIDCAEGVREAAASYQESADNIESGFGHATTQSEELAEKANEVEGFADDLENDAGSLNDFDEDAEVQEAVDTLGSEASEDDVAAEVQRKKEEWADEQRSAAHDALSNSPF